MPTFAREKISLLYVVNGFQARRDACLVLFMPTKKIWKYENSSYLCARYDENEIQ